jgi:glycosyltransferase involved in cell wall biosynthesis
MRVLWITENYPPDRGGMAQSCDRIVRGLRTSGVEVDIAHLASEARPPQVRRDTGGRLLTIPLNDDPAHALRRLWTDLSPEAGTYSHIVAFGNLQPMVAGPILSAWLDAPLITLLRGSDFDTGVFSPDHRGVLLDALHASAHICVVARSHQPLVSALAPHRPVSWVSNSIDTTSWQILPSERDKARAWRDANVDSGRRTIGLIGQPRRANGVEFFLDALRRSGRADAFHVLLVGKVEPAIARWLAEHHDAVAHTVLPFVNRYELPAVYAACDLVAIPSFYDGLPNVALEAAALGIPLLASDAGGLADLVDGDLGFSFQAGDSHGCRTVVEQAAEATDERLTKLGAAAAERVRLDFTPEAETAGYLRVLGEAATWSAYAEMTSASTCAPGRRHRSALKTSTSIGPR